MNINLIERIDTKMSISDYSIQDQIDLQNVVFDLWALLKTYRDRLPVSDSLIQECLDTPHRWTGSEIYLYAHEAIATIASLMRECERNLREYDDADTVRALEYTSAGARKVLANMVAALNKIHGEENE